MSRSSKGKSGRTKASGNLLSSAGAVEVPGRRGSNGRGRPSGELPGSAGCEGEGTAQPAGRRRRPHAKRCADAPGTRSQQLLSSPVQGPLCPSHLWGQRQQGLGPRRSRHPRVSHAELPARPGARLCPGGPRPAGRQRWAAGAPAGAPNGLLRERWPLTFQADVSLRPSDTSLLACSVLPGAHSRADAPWWGARRAGFREPSWGLGGGGSQGAGAAGGRRERAGREQVVCCRACCGDSWVSGPRSQRRPTPRRFPETPAGRLPPDGWGATLPLRAHLRGAPERQLRAHLRAGRWAARRKALVPAQGASRTRGP